MNRYDLQQLTQMRLKEAHLLLSGGQPSGAYYLAGYAVECALKACIARQTREYDFPDKEKGIRSYTHRPKDLLAVAELTGRFDLDARNNPRLRASWEIIGDWSEHSRYENKPEADARVLLEAIESPSDGVLPWVMQHW